MTDMRKFKTKRDIQNGFVTCLEGQNFADVTVNDICTQALVGRSTFYHHYADKYALLTEMVGDYAAKFEQLLTARVTQISDDEPLILLYQGLAADAPAITRLLQVHEREGDLRERYLNSFAMHADQILPQTLTIPRSFALALYSSTALTAISWALAHGSAAEISHFMNRLVRDILSTEV
ncbi:TetR/AcrR family transcriptional regulator [Lacticaseibacillus songhuajiangensis]|uniref:TetR/AcrR family transcriptional regulator n=1 Tax=Lacticaseibacillus songhuajiangensis TaxID=1296539 RepID=UPI000F783C27|nr:TetR/AcrR family transcriptional regulator [Lacticaseibacillus songhuajiangensis]